MMTLNSNLPKKRGRPLGSRDKCARKVAKKVSSKGKAFKQPDPVATAFKQYVKEYDPVATLAKIKAIDAHVAEQNIKIINLEHQIIGYKAVISYLEYQLGTK
jgi:hypothetical protein